MLQWKGWKMKDKRSIDYKVHSMLLWWMERAVKSTMENERQKLEDVYSIWSACINWSFLLMNEKTSSSYLVLETQVDMEASTLMAISGFYRHANLILRGWLELSFLGLWFDNNPKLFQEWLKDKESSPFRRRGWFKKRWLTQLLSEEPYKEFEAKYKLNEEALNLYGELSKATHAKGRKFLETLDRGDTVTRYRTDSFQKWFLNLKQVFETTSTALALKYSTVFKQDREETRDIQNLLSKQRIEQLKEVLKETSC